MYVKFNEFIQQNDLKDIEYLGLSSHGIIGERKYIIFERLDKALANYKWLNI